MSVNVVAVASGIVVTPQVVAPVVASLDGVVVAVSDVSVVLLLVPASNVEAASVWFRLELVLFDSKELVDVAVLRPSLWLLSSDKREELKVEGKLSIGLAVGGIKGTFVVMEVVVVVLLVVRGKVVWVAIVVLVTEVVTLVLVVYVVEVEAVIVSGRKVVLLVELLLSKFVRFVVLGVFVVVVVVAIVVEVAVGVVVVVVVTKVDAIVPDFGHSTKTRRKRFKEKEKCKRKQRNASKDNKHTNTQHAHARTGW